MPSPVSSRSSSTQSLQGLLAEAEPATTTSAPPPNSPSAAQPAEVTTRASSSTAADRPRGSLPDQALTQAFQTMALAGSSTQAVQPLQIPKLPPNKNHFDMGPMKVLYMLVQQGFPETVLQNMDKELPFAIESQKPNFNLQSWLAEAAHLLHERGVTIGQSENGRPYTEVAVVFAAAVLQAHASICQTNQTNPHKAIQQVVALGQLVYKQVTEADPARQASQIANDVPLEASVLNEKRYISKVGFYLAEFDQDKSAQNRLIKLYNASREDGLTKELFGVCRGGNLFGSALQFILEKNESERGGYLRLLAHAALNQVDSGAADFDPQMMAGVAFSVMSASERSALSKISDMEAERMKLVLATGTFDNEFDRNELVKVDENTPGYLSASQRKNLDIIVDKMVRFLLKKMSHENHHMPDEMVLKAALCMLDEPSKSANGMVACAITSKDTGGFRQSMLEAHDIALTTPEVSDREKYILEKSKVVFSSQEGFFSEREMDIFSAATIAVSHLEGGWLPEQPDAHEIAQHLLNDARYLVNKSEQIESAHSEMSNQLTNLLVTESDSHQVQTDVMRIMTVTRAAIRINDRPLKYLPFFFAPPRR